MLQYCRGERKPRFSVSPKCCGVPESQARVKFQGTISHASRAAPSSRQCPLAALHILLCRVGAQTSHSPTWNQDLNIRKRNKASQVSRTGMQLQEKASGFYGAKY